MGDLFIPPPRKRDARDSFNRRTLLDLLRLTLDTHPETLEWCAEADITNLQGFAWWLWSRKCKVCQRRVPATRQKCCSARCSWKWSSRRKQNNKLKRGLDTWYAFSQRVVRPLRIEDIATKLGVDVDEARKRAEADVKRRRLDAYRGPSRSGPIREVGVPVRGL